MEPSITCPRCGKTSHHPKDVGERYCGACHQFHHLMPKTRLGEYLMEVRHDDSEQVDDVVVRTPALVRLERMDTNRWWLRIDVVGEESLIFWFTTSGRALDVTVEREA